VLRERDGAVLWLDLEMAKVKWKDVRPEDFDDMAKFEFRKIEACFKEAEEGNVI